MSDLLNLNQSPDDLNRIYGEMDYYWYLRSQQFADAFLTPLAEIINRHGFNCLDVACGEGQLSPFVRTPYKGIDGSASAIEKAMHRYPDRDFEVARIEDFDDGQRRDVAVFGGVFSVIIKPEKAVDFIKDYVAKFDLTSFIVYDLWQFDQSLISSAFSEVEYFEGYADVPGLLEVKKKRKVILYHV